MANTANITEARDYRYQGRRFGWRFLEEWSFDSPLSPEELRARLEATWEEPFRAFGRGSWTMYRLCAVFRRDGSVVIRDFKEEKGEFARRLTPARFVKQSGQRFVGRITPTGDGSRLKGWADYGNFGREMFWIVSWFVAFFALGHTVPGSPGYGLAALTAVGAALNGFSFLSSTLLASGHREAFWRFLDTVSRTPPGEPLRDDVHLESEKLKEAKATASYLPSA